MDKYLVTRDEIDAYEGIGKTHFLNPNGQRLNKSLGDLTGLDVVDGLVRQFDGMLRGGRERVFACIVAPPCGSQGPVGLCD